MGNKNDTERHSGEIKKEDYHKKIVEFYAHYAPEKKVDPHDVDTLIENFKGREQELMDALLAKYGPKPPTDASGSAAAAASSSNTMSPSPSRQNNVGSGMKFNLYAKGGGGGGAATKKGSASSLPGTSRPSSRPTSARLHGLGIDDDSSSSSQPKPLQMLLRFCQARDIPGGGANVYTSCTYAEESTDPHPQLFSTSVCADPNNLVWNELFTIKLGCIEKDPMGLSIRFSVNRHNPGSTHAVIGTGTINFAPGDISAGFARDMWHDVEVSQHFPRVAVVPSVRVWCFIEEEHQNGGGMAAELTSESSTGSNSQRSQMQTSPLHVGGGFSMQHLNTWTGQPPARLTPDEVAHIALNYSKQIGHGGFSTVYEGNYFARDVAIKMLTIRDQKEMDMFNEELASMNNPYLWHRNVLPLLAYCVERPAFVFPKLKPLTLERLMRLPGDVCNFICTEIATGLAHMHARWYVHRDIKPDNILIETDDNRIVTRALMGDLGCIKPCNVPVFPFGSIIYMDPTLHQMTTAGIADYPHPVDDVYMLGVTFLAVFLKSMPQNRQHIEVMMQTLESVDPTRGSLVRRMTYPDKTQRPSCWHVVQELRHPQLPPLGTYPQVPDPMAGQQQQQQQQQPQQPTMMSTASGMSTNVATTAPSVASGQPMMVVYNNNTGGVVSTATPLPVGALVTATPLQPLSPAPVQGVVLQQPQPQQQQQQHMFQQPQHQQSHVLMEDMTGATAATYMQDQRRSMQPHV